MTEPELKAYLICDAETVIAYDSSDAIVVWEETTGESWESYFFNDEKDIVELPMDYVQRIYLEENVDKEKYASIPTVSPNVYEATIAEWIKVSGRCYLCSTEW